MVVVLTLALGVRLGAATWWQSRVGDQFYFGDSESYWYLARAIAQGEPYEFGAPDARIFRSPGYPLVLAPLFVLGGKDPPILWARWLGAVLGTLAVVGVGWIAWRLFDAKAAVAAAFLAAIEPGAVAMSVMVLSEALFCPLMVLHLGLWIAASSSSKPAAAGGSGGVWRHWLWRVGGLSVAAGLASGAAVLTRPSWLLFAPFAVFVGIAWSRSRAKETCIAATMLVAMALALVPWWVRNYRAVGHFVPTTLQVGASLYDGWNPRATGASDLSVIEPIAREERQKAAADPARSLPYEYRLDRRLRDEAMAWARGHPAQVLWLAVVKFVRTWSFWPNEPGLSAWPIRLAIVVTYVPIVCLAVLTAVRRERRGWPYALAWLPAVYFTALHMVFVGSIRYRVPAMLMLAVLAGGAVGEGPRWMAAWRRLIGKLVPTQPGRVHIDCSRAAEFRLVAAQVGVAGGGDGIGVGHPAPQPAGGS